MALSEIDLIKIKADYTAGELSRSKIAQNHRISRNTLAKHAKEGKWGFGKNAQELSKLITEKTYEKLVENAVDRATKITNQFLGDIDTYRQLAMVPASELIESLGRAKKESTEEKPVKVSKEEFSRIWESTKAIKSAVETLKLGYEGARKALGMDREDDIEKARKIKGAEKQPILDPTEGMDETQIDEQIKALE